MTQEERLRRLYRLPVENPDSHSSFTYFELNNLVWILYHETNRVVNVDAGEIDREKLTEISQTMSSIEAALKDVL